MPLYTHSILSKTRIMIDVHSYGVVHASASSRHLQIVKELWVVIQLPALLIYFFHAVIAVKLTVHRSSLLI